MTINYGGSEGSDEKPSYRRNLRQAKAAPRAGGAAHQQNHGGTKSHYRLAGSASEQDAFNAGVEWQPATGLNKFVSRSKVVRNGVKKKNNIIGGSRA